MTGESNLKALLASMNPALIAGEFVFCTVSHAQRSRIVLDSICEFREAEGVTLIVPSDAAEQAGIASQYPCRLITLNVHSSLDAVGFLAAITTRLAAHGIGVNAISAYYHDHLFVPIDRAEEALTVLRGLADESRVDGVPS